MSNIWEFLLQTLTASLAAGLLLVVKALLKDHLSPRWQYAVWGVLALRVLLPVSMARQVLLPLPYWTEVAKGLAERSFRSAYTQPYASLELQHGLPVIEGAPRSVTDWLFLIYVIGLLLSLGRYLLSYLRLRRLLGRGMAASEQVQCALSRVCESYGLRPCRVVAVQGLPAALICGVLRPILAVPVGREVDDKILLHELLHLKHLDALQNVGWCILRSLHWCNPFLQYVFDRIGNDMESLCDQRVLERLEGEGCRAYGVILLDMASHRYARAPGTSSISNGGRNISRRIDAIVRFKRYPRGMALVSVCVAVVLACPIVVGSATAYAQRDYQPATPAELHRAMALARISRCTTVAGALDTYAKGLLCNNGIYIAAASSLDEHGALAAAMEENWLELLRMEPKEALEMSQAGINVNQIYRLERGDALARYDLSERNYKFYNLEKLPDGSYQGILALYTDAVYTGEPGEDFFTILIPVAVRHEDAWVVEETGERQVRDGYVDERGLPGIQELSAVCGAGTVTVKTSTVYETYSYEGIDVDAELRYAGTDSLITYDANDNAMGGWPASQVGMQVRELDSPDEEPDFPKEALAGSNFAGSGSDGSSWVSRKVDEEWDGILRDGGGSGWGGSGMGDELIDLPAAYAVRIYWDGELVEELVLTEEGSR